MDIDNKQLELLKKEVDEILRCSTSVWNGVRYESKNELTDAGKAVIELIDEEMARQSVTDEAVVDAIANLDQLKNSRNVFIDMGQHYAFPMKLIYGEYLDLAITALQQMQGWISVKDRLPTKEDTVNKDEEVLCLHSGYGEIGTMSYKYIEDYEYLGITHWMSLPKPPKGE